MVAAAGAGERLRADPQRFAQRMGELLDLDQIV